MPVELRDANLDGLLFICRNLRERDRAEVFATRFDDDPDVLAHETLQTGEFQWLAYKDDEPVAAIGAVPRWPGCWAVWAFGTDRWPDVVLTLTRHVRRFMIPALFNAGARSAMCFALDSHHDARRWLVSLGAREDHALDNYGKNGETFVLYRWRRAETRLHVPYTAADRDA